MQDIQPTPPTEGGRITLFHVVIVGLSLALTLGAYLFSLNQVEKQTALRFEAARDSAIGLISDRMKKYEDALWAGAAAIESHGGEIGYWEWHAFARNLRIENRYPGINGIGVIHFHGDETLGDYLGLQRRDRPGFTIYPEHDFRPRMPITFIEPEGINAAAIGLDVAHEINRRTAALASRDTGEARITGPIVLVQDAGKTSGFLFYVPFYRGGPQPDVAGRRENALGLVYAPFVVHKLMEGLLAKNLRGVRFSIRDAGEVIYDEHGTEDPTNDPDPMFREEVTLDLYGRTWILDMRTDLGFRAANTSAKPTIILAAGLLIEALIVALILLMARANKRAVAYADRVTAELREEKSKLVEANAQLSAKNEEIQRFAYIASHDLKTPIRGIGGLTEMIQEDLEDYLSSPTANSDVACNLDRIIGRVERMEKLTNGIIAFSRVDTDDTAGEPVSLGEIVSDLIHDLAIRPSAVRLDGGEVTTGCDPTNFRSVLENLIGNAVKHGGGADDLRIDVAATREDGWLHVSVSDNGPGIDDRFHNRIFEMFQTLGTGGPGGSTGIGLAMVRKAVERHGGRIDLTSAPGEGATFRFAWPAGPARDRPDGIDRAA